MAMGKWQFPRRSTQNPAWTMTFCVQSKSLGHLTQDFFSDIFIHVFTFSKTDLCKYNMFFRQKSEVTIMATHANTANSRASKSGWKNRHKGHTSLFIFLDPEGDGVCPQPNFPGYVFGDGKTLSDPSLKQDPPPPPPPPPPPSLNTHTHTRAERETFLDPVKIMLLKNVTLGWTECKLVMFAMRGRGVKQRMDTSTCVYPSSATFIWAASWENRLFAYAKTKAQISCAVIAQLISAFVFATQICTIILFFLNPNFKPLAIFYNCAARFVPDLVWNTEDRVSHVAAHFISNVSKVRNCLTDYSERLRCLKNVTIIKTYRW